MTLVINAIVGGIIGMLINYFSDVLPVSRSFTRPLCKVCNQPYSIKDYLVYFRCSQCGSRIPSRSIIVLISSIVVCMLLNYFPVFHSWFLGNPADPDFPGSDPGDRY